jgi:hypothetical protein
MKGGVRQEGHALNGGVRQEGHALKFFDPLCSAIFSFGKAEMRAESTG